jgi:CSLREA domain-containing protein
VLLFGNASLPPAAEAARAPFSVNTTADLPDAVPGDGFCGQSGVPNSCSLRAAVQESNALYGPDKIDLLAGTYTLTIRQADSIYASDDTAQRDDLDIRDDLTISGAGAGSTVVDGGRFDRVFHVVGSPTVQISGLTVQNGASYYGDGGGIYNQAGKLTLADLVLQNDWSPDHAGGGLWTGGPTTLKRVTVIGNTGREAGGGGVYVHSTGSLNLVESTIANNHALAGGGLYLCGPTTIVRSVIYGNSAFEGAGISVCPGVAVSVTNATISGNSANGQGGGLLVSGSATLTNVTVAYNSAAGGGGLSIGSAGSARLGNTMVVYSSQSGGNCGGARPLLIKRGHDLDDDGSCGFPNNGDNWPNTPDSKVNLGPFQNNGGLTLTHGFTAASSAIDSGDGSICPTVDQRGFPRPVDGNGNGTALCDIGALEQQSALPW